MVNLLPPEQKKRLIAEKNWRLVLILGTLLIAFLICFALILFSLKIYVSGQVEVQKIVAETAKKEFKTSAIRGFEKKIKSVNQNLSKLNSFYKETPNLTRLLEKISRTLPSGVYLTGLSISLSEEKGFGVSLKGFCPSREILFKLKKNLEAVKDFKQIRFPLSSWIKPTDIHFNITFKAA